MWRDHEWEQAVSTGSPYTTWAGDFCITYMDGKQVVWPLTRPDNRVAMPGTPTLTYIRTVVGDGLECEMGAACYLSKFHHPAG